MNIVKGVAELIRRTSGGQSADLDSGFSSVRFTPPTPVIRFSEAGDEGMLKILWERFENAVDKEEKRKLLKIFLKQFLVVYHTWEPISLGQSPDGASSIPHSDYPQNDDHEVVGCSCGHPAEIIANLIEEVQHISTLIMDWTPSSARAIDESLVVLNALAIATRSMHNCRVLGYYGGIQKLTALMKACVVHLKEITSVLSGDESLPDMAVEKITLLQKILAHIVLVFCNFINLQSDPYEKDQLSKHNMESVAPRSRETATGLSKITDAHISDEIQRYQQKAIVSLMEAGGLNWLVELLRVMRRLSMKEFWTDMSLQYLTLRTLRSALADNPRGQNHFRSIGGLEVLLDGLGISSSSVLRLKELSTSETTRTENPLLGSFQLHVLSLQVLREAVFGNLNNLQFLCENGRVQKIANSFCSLAFSLQEYEQLNAACALSDKVPFPNLKDTSISESPPRKPSPPSTSMNLPLMQNWSDYVGNLSAVLCTFLLASETTKKLYVQPAAGRSNMQMPSVYSQLSVKWFVRVLLTVFPCIRACSNQTELPSHLRKFVYSLQRSVLTTFRKVLALTPSLLDVFRAEGVWDFFFSENFFYFAPTSDELSSDKGNSVRSGNIVDPRGQTNIGEFEAVKIEVISFMEFAATLSGSSQNLAECSILLDALEHSACNPEIAKALAESLLHILQLSEEKAGSSFKTLDAIPRVLKVACVQVHESQRSGSLSSNPGSRATVSGELNQHWHKSIEASIQLFKAYFSGSDDAKNRVLHSKACIDSLLELFWEKSLRNCMLAYILELMKDRSLSGLDRNAKLYVCSKYLEAFAHVKEREINFTELSIDLLCGMQDTLKSNQKYYQDLFREAECFLHVVSLLNGNLNMANGEKLVLNVLQTLTCLLSGNDVSKASFRALVGKGHLTLQSLLLDFCQQNPSENLLNALLDMLVDGKFDVKVNTGIKNEDVVLLYLSVLKKSSESSVHNGLNVFLKLLRDSISNRASCVRAGILNFLLDWFSQEDNDSVVSKLAQLIQIIGGHSISGKDIRKIFALLRSDKVGSQRSYCSLLLNSMLAMLNEKGPTAFIELNGIDSGIIIKTPIQWPSNKGYSFTCWLRIENFPESGAMGLFSFLTENGKGCYAVLSKDRLIYESNYHKRQCISLPVNFVIKKWHFLCLTHTIGRAFSGGSLLRCYLDGSLVFSDKCRYAKVSEPLTICTIGTKVYTSTYEEENTMSSVKDTSPFFGQIGPLYMFNDAITPEQVQGIYSLGPSYMYSFRDNESAVYLENPLAGGVLDAKDGLASKIMFGLNSQASSGRMLFNISPLLEHVLDKNVFEAIVQNGSQLCSRRLLQQIIYCVGGVSVFFPLFTQSALFENGGMEQAEQSLLTSVRREHGAAEITELIASVLDDNLANQQQMLLLSGFSVLGFLLRSIPPEQLNLGTLSALKRLFNVIMNCALSEKLVQDAISSIFLNPLIWLHTVYKVQRELYMFLIQQFDNDPRLLKNLCRLPRVLDIITEFYCDDVKGNSNSESKLHVDSMGSQNMERPAKEEMHKIRLLLLSLGEMSLRQHILVSDIRALVTFFETNQDMSCIEDVLHMIIRAISQTQILASFLEQVNLLGGCHIFVNLLQRDLRSGQETLLRVLKLIQTVLPREFEPIRLLGLQFIGRLLVGLPLEKKGLKFFNISVGKSKSLSDSHKRISLRMQPIFHLMSDRLFKFPQTEILCATLFDVLLGGASPKQVLQRHNQLDRQRSSRQNSQFFLPHILVLIFKFLAGCDEANMRKKILSDLLDLLDSNPSNIEALMEYGWNDWLYASAKLNVLKNYQGESGIAGDADLEEQNLVRNIYCVVLSHYILFVRGGWQQLEDTVEFLLLQSEDGNISYRFLLRDVYNDLIQKLTELSSQDHMLISQPCRDNTLYILKLVDEMLISENDHKLPFPASILDTSPDSMELDNHKDLASALFEVLQGEANENTRDLLTQKEPEASDGNKIGNGWWNLYDNLWVIISEMNGKGSSKMFSRSSSSATPSLGQRARGLVESLNIPAAEMAAVVVSGGIGNALAGKPNKPADKAMLLRGEKCPRIVFRLVVLYLCKSSLERACQCIQQVIPLLPCLLTSDDEQSKSRLQLFIWALLIIRSRYGMLDDGARFHAISRLIRETVNSGKSMLANSMVFSNEFTDSASNLRDSGTIHNLIQKDRVLAAVSDEVNYINTAITERSRQLQELRCRLEESSTFEFDRKKAFEEEIKVSLNVIEALDDSRRASFQLALDEEKQIVTEKWMHTIRSLIDERGPWSANHFPNNIITHWKLDKTEDDWRRRQKLRRNYQFDERLCRPPSVLPTSESRSPSESKSITSVHIPEQMKRLLLKGVRKITDEGSSEINDGESESNSNNASTSEDVSDRLQSEVERQTNDQKDVLHERKDISSPSTEPEDTEVLMSLPCVLVTPKRKIAGCLAVMKTLLHFFGELLVEGTGGTIVFRCFDSSGNFDSSKFDRLEGVEKKKLIRLPISSDLFSERESVKESTSGGHEKKQHSNVKRHRRWNVCKIKGVHSTRYLLRYSAIEVFFGDSIAPIFLNFSSQKDAKDVGNLIVTMRNDALFPKGYKDKSAFISFIDRRVALEVAETARESWRRRDISNFEYLMVLNTLAGRSYNDLTQYPIFPWVLADYSSEVLDFNKSSTFRDLSKPVGALDPKRFEVFEDRYRSFCDPDIPSFYYGSHYSSMGIVLFYLIRLEPFTALHRNLQGGKFDHADRLFQSIEGAYRNCLSNTSDVKELIPEFFYMPDFLVNSNSYYFGRKQDGEPLEDICLPPWAKGSPEEFISKNREALESEYVSSNLHHWIDLVFGYKQRGKPAVEAANIFYYLTYEGAVDLETMEDELQRAAIEDQIANFGQTPIQIFRKKHPRRGPPIPIAHPLQFSPSSINLTSIVPCTTMSASALIYVNVLDSNVVLINEDLSMSVKVWLTTQLQSGGNFTFSSSQDPFFGIGFDILSARRIGSSLAENFDLGAQCFATLRTSSENFLISCGNWENSFQIISLSDGRMVQSIRQHKDVVSCIAVASDGGILATGSYDTTVMVWEVLRVRTSEKRARNPQLENPRKDYIVADTPFHILCGHDDILTCLYVSVELDVVISGSKDGTCIFHTLREGRYVRSLQHPSGCSLSKLAVSRHGRVVLYADDDLSLHLYSINGKHIASSESHGRLNCVELSCCGDFLVCAGDQGEIFVRSMNTLEIVRKYSGKGKVITSLTVTAEECFLAGTKDGTLFVYSIENPQLRKTGVLRHAKSRA